MTTIMGGEVGALVFEECGPNNQHEEETGAQHRTRRSRSICSERTRTRTITMTRTMMGTRTRSACDSGGEDDKHDGAFDGAVCDRRSSLAMTTMGRLPGDVVLR
jgi:hypothetical protein